MYYSININKRGKKYCSIATFFVLIISVFAFQSNIFADEYLEKEAEDYHTMGYEAQRNGNFGRALTLYSKALAIGLDGAVIYNDIGVVYEQLGALDKAEEYYLQSINRNPRYNPPFTNLAYLYLEKGDTQSAISYFHARLKHASRNDLWAQKIREELKRIDPNYRKKLVFKELELKRRELRRKAHDEFVLGMIRSEKHYQQGMQLLMEEKYDEAVSEMDLALAITPDNPKILAAKKSVLYKKTIAGIRKMADSAIQKLEQGELETARKEYQEILTAIPKEPIQKSE